MLAPAPRAVGEWGKGDNSVPLPLVSACHWKEQTLFRGLVIRLTYESEIKTHATTQHLREKEKCPELKESVHMSPLKLISVFLILIKAKDRIRSKVRCIDLPKNINCE